MLEVNYMKNIFSKNSLTGKSFIVTLSLCLLAVGAAGIYSYAKYSSDLKEELSAKTDELKDQLANVPNETLPRETIETTAPVTEEKVDETEKEEAVTEADVKISGKAMDAVVRPINGEVIAEFSGGELVKSTTLNVWKTHDGVDIAADANEKVKSMTSGTVTQVYNDVMWGNCVVIDHGNGIEGHYYNLATEIPVVVGQDVSAGTVIGAIGNSAECEIKDPSHLHLGIKQNGEWIDPIALISGEGS